MTFLTDTGLNSDQIVVGTARGPGLWIGPIDAEPPQDIDEDWDLDEGWKPLGYASEDGPTVSSATDSTDLRGWQSLGVLRSIITGRTVTIQFQLLQWNALNLSLYWDIDMPTVVGGKFEFAVRSDQSGRRHQMGLDIRDGDNRIRIIFPRVQLQAAGDMNFQRGALAVLDVTFSALETEGVLLGVMGDVPAVGVQGYSAQAHDWFPFTVPAEYQSEEERQRLTTLASDQRVSAAERQAAQQQLDAAARAQQAAAQQAQQQQAARASGPRGQGSVTAKTNGETTE